MKSFKHYISENDRGSRVIGVYRKVAVDLEPEKARTLLASIGITGKVSSKSIPMDKAWGIMREIGWTERSSGSRVLLKTSKCGKCMGSGDYLHYGSCFGCSGTGKVTYKGGLDAELDDMMARAFGGPTRADKAALKATAAHKVAQDGEALLRVERLTAHGLADWLVGTDGGKNLPPFVRNARRPAKIGGVPTMTASVPEDLKHYPEMQTFISLWREIGRSKRDLQGWQYSKMKEMLEAHSRRGDEARFRKEQFVKDGVGWLVVGDGWDCPLDVEEEGMCDIWEKAGKLTLSDRQFKYLVDVMLKRQARKGFKEIKMGVSESVGVDSTVVVKPIAGFPSGKSVRFDISTDEGVIGAFKMLWLIDSHLVMRKGKDGEPFKLTLMRDDPKEYKKHRENERLFGRLYQIVKDRRLVFDFASSDGTKQSTRVLLDKA